jgi:hypothetical protein
MSQDSNVYPLKAPVVQRECPSCGGVMLISEVEPYQKDSELRVFECTRCAYSEKLVVKPTTMG